MAKTLANLRTGIVSEFGAAWLVVWFKGRPGTRVAFSLS